jgi:hypothetical protein
MHPCSSSEVIHGAHKSGGLTDANVLHLIPFTGSGIDVAKTAIGAARPIHVTIVSGLCLPGLLSADTPEINANAKTVITTFKMFFMTVPLYFQHP